MIDRNCDCIGIGRWEISLGEFGQTEVEHFHESVTHKTIMSKHDVFGFDIAMHNAFGMRRFQSHCYLNCHTQRFINVERIQPKAMPQGLTFNKLRSYVMRRIDGSDFEDSENVGMIERQHCPGFLLESSQATLIVREFGWQDFDGDLSAVLLRVFSEIYVAHPATAQAPQNAIVTYRLRNLEAVVSSKTLI
jgi:hypothetical protein